METNKEMSLLKANYALLLNELERTRIAKTIAEQEAKLWKTVCGVQNGIDLDTGTSLIQRNAG